MASSVIFEERVEIPYFRSLAEFRAWTLSDDFPERGRIDYIGGRIEVRPIAEKGVLSWGRKIMITDVGEYLASAYLQLIDKCDFIQYNVRPPHGGLEGLGELDVVGFNFETKTAYLCEVTTHICGLQYGSNVVTAQKLKDKHQRQMSYAKKYLTNFDKLVFQFWSPVVHVGFITVLATIPQLELRHQRDHTRRVRELEELAGSPTYAA